MSEIVRNETTGEEVRFIRTADETGGELLVLENRWTRRDHVVPPHCHPSMEERWMVIEGAVAYIVDGEETVAGPGETVIAPPGTTHTARNAGDTEVLVRIEMRPACRWEDFVRQLFALASEQLSDEVGASAFQELFEEFAPEIELVPDDTA